MPIYEYKCPNGHLFEVFHGMTEPGPRPCEVCGAAPLQRVLHPVAVHYKGSGFYSTDYGRAGARAKDGRRLVGRTVAPTGASSYKPELQEKLKEVRRRARSPAEAERQPEPRHRNGRPLTQPGP